MCGIAGELRFDDTPPDLAALARMNAQQQARGPDSGGIFAQGAQAWGHRRLKIMDLCEASGQDLDRITAGSPSGDGSVIWYFLTDKGLHFYKVIGDEAVMFDGETEEERARVNVAEVVTPVG